MSFGGGIIGLGGLGYRVIYALTPIYNLSAEQLFEGWRKAVVKCKVATPRGLASWNQLSPNVVSAWQDAARNLQKRATPLTSAEEFLTLFMGSLNPSWITPDVMAVVKELVDNWAGYFDFSANTSLNAKGDVWLFKASKLKATVLDVDGTKLKLRLANGTETDWIEEDVVAKSATKSV